MQVKLSKKEKAYLGDVREDIINYEGLLTNIRDIYIRALKYFSGRVSLVEKRDGEDVPFTIDQIVSDINALGTALIAKGMKGRHIALLGENSYEWVISFLAISCGVGVAVPLDRELPDETLSMLMDKGDCEGVMFSKSYRKTIKKHFENHPDFLLACSMYSNKELNDRTFSFDSLIELGNKLIEGGNREFIDAPIDPEDMAAIMFTSGTTGANKGVMFTHKNISTNVDGIISTVPTEYTSISILPMNHAYELSCDVLTCIYMNSVLFINDSLKHVQQNLFDWNVNAVCSVPLILEQIYTGVWKTAQQGGQDGALRKLVKLSNKLREHGIDIRDKLFGMVLNKFCDEKPQTLVCGSAPSRAEYIAGMGDFGFRVYNGYGLTEASPTVTLNLHADEDPTSAGYPFPKTRVVIHDPDEDGIGEIYIKGNNVTKGYYKDEEATKASFTEDGWFKTGDYGRMTQDGELFISGRKKNIIILDNGENIFPEDLEFTVMDNVPYLTQAICLEATKDINGRPTKYIACAVNVNREMLDGLSDEEIVEKTKKDIFAVNKKMPSYKKITDVLVVFTDFEINSTRKVIRQKVIDLYNNSVHA